MRLPIHFHFIKKIPLAQMLEFLWHQNKNVMKTFAKRFVAGASFTIFVSAFNACSPVWVEPSRHLVYAPAPVPPPPPAPVTVITPVVPVWAPPYVYVNEVHYYYFPDYMAYYDVFAQNYC